MPRCNEDRKDRMILSGHRRIAGSFRKYAPEDRIVSVDTRVREPHALASSRLFFLREGHLTRRNGRASNGLESANTLWMLLAAQSYCG